MSIAEIKLNVDECIKIRKHEQLLSCAALVLNMIDILTFDDSGCLKILKDDYTIKYDVIKSNMKDTSQSLKCLEEMSCRLMN